MTLEKRKFIALKEEVQSLRDEVLQLRSNCEYYEEQNATLKRLLFGKKSEKSKTVPLIPGQLFFPEFSHLENAAELYPPKSSGNVSSKNKDRKKGRRRVNPNLPVEEIIIPVPDDKRKNQDGDDLVLLGYETAERLHRKPAKLVKQVIKREIYGHKDIRERVAVAPVPPSINPKGKLSDELCHHVVVEKFFNGVPLYRQCRFLNAKGADLSKSVLSDAVRNVALFYEPVYSAILDDLLQSKFLHMDETRIKMSQEDRNGFFWLVRNRDHCYVHFGPSRSGDEALRALAMAKGPPGNKKLWNGYLMVDDYGGYNQLCDIFDITRMACWAHVRRNFFKIHSANEIAAWFVSKIGELYEVESVAKKKAVAEMWDEEKFWKKRREMREKISGPVIEEIEAEGKKHISRVLPESHLGKALSYMLKLMPALRVYLENGELPLDNNDAERSIRLIVIGRKNFLFVGNSDFGKYTAICYSLMESCRLNEINPQDYFTYTTKMIHEHPNINPMKLTPFAVKDNIQKIQVNF